jgi:hypothetical protein
MRSKDEAKNVAKKFSKIAVDEIIHSHEIIFSEPIPEAFALLDEKKYWHSVKQQIDLI